MTPEALFKLIRAKGSYKLFPTEVRFLFRLDKPAYDEVVSYLLADNGEYVRSLPTYHYADVYDCQVFGSVLFAMRPNPNLYEQLLQNSIKIGDPSSCRDAVAAMLQVKSSGEVALDFLRLIDSHRHDANADETIGRIFSMFYWLGYGPASLMANRAWPGNRIYVLYFHWFNVNLMWPDEKDPETGYPLTPPTTPERAQQIATLILEKMLDLFEERNVGETARVISALLPSPNRADLTMFRDRLIHAVERALASPDEYVRRRAEMLL